MLIDKIRLGPFRIFRGLVALFGLVVLGCAPAKDKPPKGIEPSSDSLDTAANQTQIRNCPVMLTPMVSLPRDNDARSWLSFSLKGNPDFNPDKDDACKGDMKNLWADLRQFERELETHAPFVRSIAHIASYVNHFPVTETELKDQINQAAIDEELHEALLKHDRTTLEGGIRIQNEIARFVRQSAENYWMTEHAPIIETILSDHRLKLANFSMEKISYCYPRFDRCGYVRPGQETPPNPAYEFEYRGAFGGFGFQRPENADP